MTMSNTQYLKSNVDPDMRLLRDEELEFVVGGAVDNCIRYNTLVITTQPPTGDYKDPFASILPSWVRPL
jgi:hypothetical protein